MSIVLRSVLLSIAVSLLTAILVFIAVFMVNPFPDLATLWERQLFGLPFILVVPAASLVLGVFFGLLHGFAVRRQLKQVEEGLREMENGRSIYPPLQAQGTEMDALWKRMKNVQRQVTDQARASQKLANEKAEDQEKIIQEMISRERHRLARELHDSVSQQLFAASMLMSAINESREAEEAPENRQLKLVEQMIHQSQLEMRALLLHLRPAALKGKSLQEGIKELLAELVQKVPIEIHAKIEEMPLDKGVEDHLFRILQESVSNTLRHAKATSLEILLIEREELIILRVADNGVGFAMDEDKAGSYGLQNMQERALEIGGTMKVVSLPDKGTRLEVKVPVISVEDDKND
ncbi:sensor histidine kinase [Fictibacillus sp. WQ 8-8]|uniref:sensor histidine kinase n=1 Tax=Fictibacillus sp. WQ 8-8 TaxID=2938788 RepID=UPI0008F45367|nr:sensor histidine kinase [Fictibacillus sp. WQ 8-8]MCQ6265020.1 sensor histidine kinase [Fictibacillus sp. WQ 8-8]SFE96516.1 two-component system, NarL family, sensor histidine kinase LiaS [Bacillus sp. OV194]